MGAEASRARPQNLEDDAGLVSADAPSVKAGADLKDFRKRAREVYELYRTQYHTRFYWLDPKFFGTDFRKRLLEDAEALLSVLNQAGTWKPDRDAKLVELHKLLTKTHRKDKVLIFTQFADTAIYLGEQLEKLGVTSMAVATNETSDPITLARRFSPSTNGGLSSLESELRVLLATDVLAEGQNLQDAHIVVNYDLPWAIIRLIQRAGRVDRIGQKHDTIFAYSFLPVDGVEEIIHLRQRLFHRLQANQEVLGTDESFFGEDAANKLRDLYTEKQGALDDDQTDEDIDLASLALQVWNSASADDQKAAQRLSPVVAATGPLPELANPRDHPAGVISYLRFPDNTDALVRVDDKGNLVSQSLSGIFQAAACAPDAPPLKRAANHHELVSRCVEIVMEEQQTFAGHLGSLRSISRKVGTLARTTIERLGELAFSMDELGLCPLIYRNTDTGRLPCGPRKLAATLGWQYGPNGLVLHGPTGCGKSRAAWLLLRRLHFEGYETVAFNAVSFSHEVAYHFGPNGDAVRWVRRIHNAPVVFLDDLGKCRLTERGEAELFGLVEARAAQGRPIIATTTFVGDTLAATMHPETGAALVRRLRDFCECIAFSRARAARCKSRLDTESA
ncbi:MAG TPA: helicase-related protein [Verrucomicrobiae bacterium]|nr:helicase-related protein [Verrucomicrobiae bacterium]